MAGGALFLSDGTRRLRGLVVSVDTSIQTKETKLHWLDSVVHAS